MKIVKTKYNPNPKRPPKPVTVAAGLVVHMEASYHPAGWEGSTGRPEVGFRLSQRALGQTDGNTYVVRMQAAEARQLASQLLIWAGRAEDLERSHSDAAKLAEKEKAEMASAK